MKRSKVLPPTYLIAAVFAMTVLHFMVPWMKLIPSPWNLLGVVLLLSGTWLSLVGDRLFQKIGTTINPFQESSTLITDGIFGLSRNPMYLGFALFLAGLAVFFGSLTPFLLIPVFVLLIEKDFIIGEEKLLEKKFGRAYLEYKRRVRRWI